MMRKLVLSLLLMFPLTCWAAGQGNTIIVGNPNLPAAGDCIQSAGGVIIEGTGAPCGGGGGTPGGLNTQVQFNNSGAFGGIGGATSDGTNIFIPDLYGGSGSGGDLTLRSTSNATPGSILFETSRMGVQTNTLGNPAFFIGEDTDPLSPVVGFSILPFYISEDVATAPLGAIFALNTVNDIDFGGSSLFAIRSRGTHASPTHTVNNDNFFSVSVMGYDLDDVSPGPTASIAFRQDGDAVSGAVPIKVGIELQDSSGSSASRFNILSDGLTGIGNDLTPTARLHAQSGDAAEITQIVQGTSSQSANLTEWQDVSNNVLSNIAAGGHFQPVSTADSAAPNNSLYYSTDSSKLVYKDPGGTVHDLY